MAKTKSKKKNEIAKFSSYDEFERAIFPQAHRRNSAHPTERPGQLVANRALKEFRKALKSA